MADTARMRPAAPGLLGPVVLHVVIIAGAIAMFFPFLWTIVT
jgi:hypothetical protein